MSNHAYIIKCKKRYKAPLVADLARRFCEEYLKGLFRVNAPENPSDEDVMQIEYVGDPILHIPFWVGTWTDNRCREHRAIEVRHSHGGDLMWWVDCSFEDFLATELKGKITDDGIDDIWEPTFREKYPNVLAWTKNLWSRGGKLKTGSSIFIRIAEGDMKKNYPDLHAAFWK